jgi:hypothetical protein
VELNIMTLKNMGREKKKKQFGKSIICSNCRTKIYYESDEEQENITRIADKIIYECGCGEEIIID